MRLKYEKVRKSTGSESRSTSSAMNRVGAKAFRMAPRARCASTHSLRADVSALGALEAAFNPPRSRAQPFANHMEETRAARSFTEETARFRVPVMVRSQEELALAVTPVDDAVHVLTQHPFGVHSFTNISRRSSKYNRISRMAEQRFINLHSLVPFGTPVPVLTALRSQAELVTFSPELGALVRLDPEEGRGSVYYIDKEAGKRRMTRFGYGHSYFGGGKEAEDGGHGSRNADDWGVDTSLSVSMALSWCIKRVPGVCTCLILKRRFASL